MAGLLTYPPIDAFPAEKTDSDILSMGFIGITVAGLSRILTGFPINRVAANQNVCKGIYFFSTFKKKLHGLFYEDIKRWLLSLI